MRKHDQSSVAAEGARRATGAAAARDRKGRCSARCTRATVLRLLRGEDLESVSRELGITAARASQWRDRFLAAGQAGLKSRATEAVDDDHRRLQAKFGELLMETELLYAKVDQLEAGRVDANTVKPLSKNPGVVQTSACADTSRRQPKRLS